MWSDGEALDAAAPAFRPRLNRDLNADHVAEPAAAQLDLDRLEQVLCVVGDLEVRVARDAEDCALGDLHAGEQRRQEMGDHGLERDERSPGRDEPGEAFGNLHPREALLAGLRVDGEDAQREREPRDVREGMPGADGERRQHRIDLPCEVSLEPSQLLGGALLDGADLDPRRGERRPQLTLPELRLADGQLRDARADEGERLLRREAVRGEHPKPADAWPIRPATRTMKNSSRFEERWRGT